jgi:hypothetical protein
MTILKTIAVWTLARTTSQADADVQEPPLRAILAAVALGLLVSTLFG